MKHTSPTHCNFIYRLHNLHKKVRIYISTITMKIEIAMSFMWGLPHIGEFFFFPYLMMVLFQALLTHNDRCHSHPLAQKILNLIVGPFDEF